MEKTIIQIIELLKIPQFWGGIITLLLIILVFVLKRAINHAFQLHLENVKSMQEENVYLRGLYDDIKDYTKEQAHALRDAYLIMYEPESSSIEVSDKDFKQKLEIARQRIMLPLRTNIVRVDAKTKMRIHDINNEFVKYTEKSKESKDAEREFQEKKDKFFKEIEECIDFIRVDKVAFRLGLIKKPLGHKEDREDK